MELITYYSEHVYCVWEAYADNKCQPCVKRHYYNQANTTRIFNHCFI